MRFEFQPRHEFFAANPRRRGSAQWDRGMWSTADRGMVHLTWIETTGEVCAVHGPLGQESYAVVGAAPCYELLEATLANPSAPTLEWAVSQIAGMPRDTADVAARVREYQLGLEREDELIAEREAASFEIVDLSDLPPTPRNLADRYCDADWRRIADLAVTLFQGGLSPTRRDAVVAASHEHLDGSDATLLVSLFTDPIVVSPGQPFTNGRHRVAAMRAAGVARCVVHTNRSWRVGGS